MDWKRVLPAWFKCLSRTTSAEEYARRVEQVVEGLDLPGRADAEPSVHVVVNVEGAAVSMLVDSIGDVVDTDSSTFERPPDMLDEWVRELILGVHKLEGRLLLVLDVMKATDVVPALAG